MVDSLTGKQLQDVIVVGEAIESELRRFMTTSIIS